MTQSAFKTLLLIVGSALGGIVVFVAGILGLAYYGDLPLRNLVFGDRPTRTVSRAPDIAQSARYPRRTAQWTGDFAKQIATRFSTQGRGISSASITAGGAPAAGLRLRLMLNGSVMSQWGESEHEGKYVDRRSLRTLPDRRLRDRPRHRRTSRCSRERSTIRITSHVASGEFSVVGRAAGRARSTLDFIDPVRKSVPLGEVSRKGKPIVVAWEPYAGARGLPGPAPRMEGMGLEPRVDRCLRSAHPVAEGAVVQSGRARRRADTRAATTR